jgi:hypothetical protein
MVERGRIARELHDLIAHNVSMMVVQAGAAERVLDGDHPHVRKALDVIASAGRQTVDEMRTLLGVLRSDAGLSGLTPQPSLAERLRIPAQDSPAGATGRRRPHGAGGRRPAHPGKHSPAHRAVLPAGQAAALASGGSRRGQPDIPRA